jgi:hypothetical protein
MGEGETIVLHCLRVIALIEELSRGTIEVPKAGHAIPFQEVASFFSERHDRHDGERGRQFAAT